MSVSTSSTGIFTNTLTILYDEGSKFPKTTKKNRQIVLFLPFLGPKIVKNEANLAKNC